MNSTNQDGERILGGEPLLAETAERLLSEHCSPEEVRSAESSGWSEALWELLAAAGLPWIGTERGGSAGTLLDAAELLHRCGRYAVPLPIAETAIIGGRLLRAAGLPLPDGPVAVPIPSPRDDIVLSRRGSDWRLAAKWHGVPWAQASECLVTAIRTPSGDEYVVVVDDFTSERPGHNLAGEPRDIVTVDQSLSPEAVVEVPVGTVERLRRYGALSRALLCGGALERSSELATAYARERKQFGKPIASFQAVQQHLVIAAEHAATAALAAWIAAGALDDDEDDPGHKVAIARAVCQESVDIVTARTHQVFGAIGMTKEHELHLRTRRCWSWTEEWGSGRYWARQLADGLCSGGGDMLWPTLATGMVRA